MEELLGPTRKMSDGTSILCYERKTLYSLYEAHTWYLSFIIYNKSVEIFYPSSVIQKSCT